MRTFQQAHQIASEETRSPPVGLISVNAGSFRQCQIFASDLERRPVVVSLHDNDLVLSLIHI